MATTNLIFGGEWTGVLTPGASLNCSSGRLAAAGVDAALSVLTQARRTEPAAVYSVASKDVRAVTSTAGMNLNWVTANAHTSTITTLRFTYCVTV